MSAARRPSWAPGCSAASSCCWARCATPSSAAPTRDAGGEYHYLSRAYGFPVGLLFGWARGTVIQTGAIAAVAFVYGEYAAVLMPLGTYGIAIHAAHRALSCSPPSTWPAQCKAALSQVTLTLLTIAALVCVILAGPEPSGRAPRQRPQNQMGGGFGLAMVFVLLTYGGWNEAAYLAGELKDPRRNMARTLLLGTGIVMLLYMLANFAYLKAFGLAGLSRTNPVGADLMRLARRRRRRDRPQPHRLRVRAEHAQCHDLHGCPHLLCAGPRPVRHTGAWPAGTSAATGRPTRCCCNARSRWRWWCSAPSPATASRRWWPTRRRCSGSSCSWWRCRCSCSGGATRAALYYRMPLYPLPPILLAAAAAWMFYSSINYAGVGALAGIVVLLAGTPLLLLRRSPA